MSAVRGCPMSMAERVPAGYRAVTDPREAAEVMRRSEDFGPQNALNAVRSIRGEALRVLSRGRFSLPAVLASHAGPQHRVVRAAVESFFTPAAVRGLRPRLEQWTAERLDAVAGVENIAETVIRHVPPRAFTALTGVDVPVPEILQPWSLDSLELFWGWPDPERQVELAHTAVEFHRWLRHAVASAPNGTLFERVRRECELAGVPVTEKQLVSLGYFLVIAGQETTSLLVNTAMAAGLEGNWPELGSDSGAARRLARQTLATASSVPAWRRVALADTELAGCPVAAGEELHVAVSGTGGPSSLAFGGGDHRCLGALLAPLEVEAIVAETARRWPGAKLVRAGRWFELSSFSAPLEVIVDPGLEDAGASR